MPESCRRRKQLKSKFESRPRDPALARENRSSVEPPIQPALRDSADSDRVAARTRPQEQRLSSRAAAIAILLHRDGFFGASDATDGAYIPFAGRKPPEKSAVALR